MLDMMKMPQFLKVVGATALRNLRADLKYKFEFVVQALWTFVNMLAFGFLGVAVGQGDSEYAPDYTMALFFVGSAAYWTLFSGNFEETTVSLREESQRGTMGFLAVNDVSPMAIMIGRFMSSSVKYMIVTAMCVVPVLFFMKNNALDNDPRMVPSSVTELTVLLLILIYAYVFMLALATLVGSLSLLFKNTNTVNKIVLYGARIISTYFTPLAAFAMFATGTDKVLFYVPITTGLVMMRRVLIEHNTSLPYGSYSQLFLVMTIINVVFLAISFAVTAHNSRAARKKGTLEFY